MGRECAHRQDAGVSGEEMELRHRQRRDEGAARLSKRSQRARVTKRIPRLLGMTSVCCVVSFLLDVQLCHAQSFDCSKASTEMEKVICQPHSELGAIDQEMGEAYKVLLAAAPAHEKGAVRDAQKQWIQERDKECMTAREESRERCLKELISRRNDELEEQLRRRLGLSPVAYNWIRAYAYLSVRYVPNYAAEVKDRVGQCPNLSPTMSRKFTTLVPDGYESLFGIATHQCDAVLRVYLRCPQSSEQEAPINWMDSCGEMMILEDIKNTRARVLGELVVESRTGNSGGIFVPVAFTKNDQHIILKSWMGDPGAGGGQVDYGYETVARNGTTEKRAPLTPKPAIFYDDFGKVVYTIDSDKLPTFSQPGPRSNNGLLVVKDLAALTERRVLEEQDTTFELVNADEKNHTLTIRATEHRFSSSCPRNEEDSLRCSKKTVHEREIPLP
jgi:uncharacterized protein YecT (DUF1311 family)